MAIPENIEQLANDVRTKVYGREVREALASGIEAAGSIANDADVRSQETETKQTSLEKKYDEQIANMSLENPSMSEVVDARVSGYDGQNFDTIGKRMDKVDAQLAEKANKEDLNVTNNVVDVIKQKQKVKKGDTWGTFENAALESVIANNSDAEPQVLGITPENDYILATYDARDTVASYRANFSRKPTVEVDNVSYTVDSVVVPDGTDLSSVKAGMIIDTKHNPKFSGLIKEIKGTTIIVYNWYQMGNTTKGQIPPSPTGLYIDPITHVWVDNVNLTLNEDDPYTGASIVEYGMINNQNDGGNRSGVHMVSMGKYRPNSAFVTTGTNENNHWIVGYLDKNSSTAFGSDNSKLDDNLLYNSQSGYRLQNDGTVNRLKGIFNFSGNTKRINPEYELVFLISEEVDHIITAPNKNTGNLCFIYNITNSEVVIRPEEASDVLNIPAHTGKVLFSDGGFWYMS